VGRTVLAPSLRGGNRRRRVGGALMVGVTYGPMVFVPASSHEHGWHWFGSVYFEYGDVLCLLPGIALMALFGPVVAYRRRDALTLFFPPRGIRVAWIIGTRLAQLPHRDWPVRTDGVELQGRQAARLAVAVSNYRLWRQGRAPIRQPGGEAEL
jgi:hypothetical protein